MESTAAVIALAALAHVSRLSVFRQLVQAGPEGAFPGDIARALALPAATLSFQLKALAHAGLVDATPEGRFMRYRARFDAMQALIDFLTRDCCGGDASRCAPVPVPVPDARDVPRRRAG